MSEPMSPMQAALARVSQRLADDYAAEFAALSWSCGQCGESVHRHAVRCPWCGGDPTRENPDLAEHPPKGWQR